MYSLTKRTQRNIETQYKILKKRELCDDIDDLSIVMQTMLYEDDGLVRRYIETNNIIENKSNTSLLKTMLMNYPIGIRSSVVAEEIKKPDPPMIVEVIELIPSYEDKYEIQKMSLMTKDVHDSDIFFEAPVERQLVRIKNGEVYNKQGKYITLDLRMKGDWIVELWDNKIHDVLECDGEVIVNKPFSYRRYVCKLSRLKNYMTNESEMAHGVICVKDSPYVPGGRGCYSEILLVQQHRLRVSEQGWVCDGQGAGQTKYYMVKKKNVIQPPGVYLLDRDFNVKGKSSWCYTKMDSEEVKKDKNFVQLYKDVHDKPDLEEDVIELDITLSGKVTDVGMRYQIWFISNKYRCQGRIYNKEGTVRAELLIVKDYFFSYQKDIGQLSSHYSAKNDIRIGQERRMNTSSFRCVILKDISIGVSSNKKKKK